MGRHPWRRRLNSTSCRILPVYERNLRNLISCLRNRRRVICKFSGIGLQQGYKYKKIQNRLFIYKYFNRELNENGWDNAINIKKESGVAFATRDFIPYRLSKYNKINLLELQNIII